MYDPIEKEIEARIKVEEERNDLQQKLRVAEEGMHVLTEIVDDERGKRIDAEARVMELEEERRRDALAGQVTMDEAYNRIRQLEGQVEKKNEALGWYRVIVKNFAFGHQNPNEDKDDRWQRHTTAHDMLQEDGGRRARDAMEEKNNAKTR